MLVTVPRGDTVIREGEVSITETACEGSFQGGLNALYTLVRDRLGAILHMHTLEVEAGLSSEEAARFEVSVAYLATAICSWGYVPEDMGYCECIPENEFGYASSSEVGRYFLSWDLVPSTLDADRAREHADMRRNFFKIIWDVQARVQMSLEGQNHLYAQVSKELAMHISSEKNMAIFRSLRDHIVENITQNMSALEAKHFSVYDPYCNEWRPLDVSNMPLGVRRGLLLSGLLMVGSDLSLEDMARRTLLLKHQYDPGFLQALYREQIVSLWST